MPRCFAFTVQIFSGFFFFNSSPVLTTAHSSYNSCSAKWVIIQLHLSLSSRCVDCVWRAGKQSEQPFGDHCIPGSSVRLPSAASGTEGKLPWGACAVGPAPHLGWTRGEEVSLSKQTEELGSCFWRARSIFQGISFSRGAIWFLGSLAWRFNPSGTYPPHTAEGIPLTF